MVTLQVLAEAAGVGPNTLVIAIIVVLGASLTALTTSRGISKQNKEHSEQVAKAQQAQWNRDDEVAARVETAAKQAAEAAALLVQTNDANLAAAEEVARIAANVAEKSAEAFVKLDRNVERVHTLVNSDMTAARRDQRDEAVGRLATLRRIVALDEAAGREPAQEDLDDIVSAEAKVVELEAILADRLVQAKIVDEQLAEQADEDEEAQKNEAS